MHPTLLSRPIAIPRLSSSPVSRRRVIEFGAVAVVLVGCLALRLWDLDDPTANFDEGHYLASLLLMRRGFRPLVDIDTGEGPLNLYLAYLPYAVGGFTLAAARVGTTLGSAVGLVGVAWGARALGGPIAGIVAALVLGLSPMYLRVSRWVGPEAAAVALVALAVGSAAWAYRTDRDRYRVAAGALFALANLVQASVPMAGLAVAVLSFRRGSLRSVLLPAVSAGGVMAITLLALGPGVVFAKVVAWRVGGRELDPSLGIIAGNAVMLADKLVRQEQPAVYALALVGAVVLLRRSPRAGAALLGWFVAQLDLLLCYTELSSHLSVTALAPLAILAGVGAAAGIRLLARPRSRPRFTGAMSFVAAAAVLWYASAVPALLDRDQRLIVGELSADRELSRPEQAIIRTVAKITGPDEFILTDQPYLAFLADRMVPPGLVDPSSARIASGALTGERVVEALRAYDVRVVVLWTDKLGRLAPLREALATAYEPVAQFGAGDDGIPRAVYRRR